MPVNLEASSRGGRTRSTRLTPEQRQEVARRGGLAAAASMTPEERKRRSLTAMLGNFTKRVNELTPTERATALTALLESSGYEGPILDDLILKAKNPETDNS